MSAKRILVIDDEKNLCSVIQACLEHLGGWDGTKRARRQPRIAFS